MIEGMCTGEEVAQPSVVLAEQVVQFAVSHISEDVKNSAKDTRTLTICLRVATWLRGRAKAGRLPLQEPQLAPSQSLSRQS